MTEFLLNQRERDKYQFCPAIMKWYKKEKKESEWSPEYYFLERFSDIFRHVSMIFNLNQRV